MVIGLRSVNVQEMNLSIAIFLIIFSTVHSKECNIVCPPEDAPMECGLDLKTMRYTMFPNKCALAAYSECYNVEFVQTPLKYCINNQSPSRRMYGESCPVFCPNHYRPVCGASKYRSYAYRTFNNGCYLDMLNCRGDDFSGYVEVPLEFCQNHAMKNIYREQVVVSNLHDYQQY